MITLFYFLQFVTKKNQRIDTQISFGNKHITNIHSTKLLLLTIDTSLSWKYHIEDFKSKLNKAYLHYKISQTVRVLRSTKNDLFFLCSFNYVI
jgi:hypothetical protein